MYEFNGLLRFERAINLLTPQAVLEEMVLAIDPFNVAFITGKGPEHVPTYGPLPVTPPQLPPDWSEEDTAALIGKLDDGLPTDSAQVLIARTSRFDEVTNMAEKIGYRPARLAEFIQLLAWGRRYQDYIRGWHFCTTGRKPGYAVLADMSRSRETIKIIFDT